MKISILTARVSCKPRKQLANLQRRTFLFMIILSLLCCTTVQAQNAEDVRISFGVQHRSLEDALLLFQQKTGIPVAYLSADVKPYTDISIETASRTAKETIRLLLMNTRLMFTIIKGAIVLSAKTNSAGLHTALTDSTLIPGVSGKVFNEDGLPVTAASVVVVGTAGGTVTNEAGAFWLKHVPGNAVIRLAALGYHTTTVALLGRKTLQLILQKDQGINQLDEVQVIGYGTTSKRYSTGSIAKISAETIQKQPVSNFISAMQGRAAGVFINSTNGLPGGAISVQIRGQNSITAGKDPLYVVDNVPFNSTPLNQSYAQLSNTALGSVNPLNALNPEDIESIEILKDADATAIYGSRGANGVILITTKKGRAGQPEVKLSVYSGTRRAARLPVMLGLKDYLLIRHEAYKNDNLVPSGDPSGNAYAPDLMVWDTTKETNWIKYMLGGSARVTDIQAGVSGGNTGTSFFISSNFRKEGTIFPGSFNYYKTGTHFNIQHSSANGKFGINLSGMVSYDKNNQIAFPVFSVLSLPPDFPVYNQQGKYNWTGAVVNPFALLRQQAAYTSFSTILNSIIRYTFFNDFTAKVSIGYTNANLKQVNIFPQSSQNPASSSATSYAQFGTNANTSLIVEPQLNYVRDFSHANINVLIGGTWQGNTMNGQFVQGSNYANEALLKSLSAAGTITSWYDNFAEYKYASLFGRATFNWKRKYIFNATVRRDGSSRFGPSNQFGNFGSAGFAWLFSSEHFIKEHLKFLSYGKLRLSYGLTGNDQIADYQYLSAYTAGNPYQNIATLVPSRIASSDYSWETNKKFETGIELGLFGNRLSATINFYSNRSSNQLVAYPLPFMSGPFGSYQANLPASIENKGWEIELSATIIKSKRFSWAAVCNLTLPRNKLLAFPRLSASAYANTYIIGQDLSTKKGYRFTHIDPQTGLRLYSTKKGGDTTTPVYNTDYFIMGRTSPYYYGGIANTFSYKGLQLDIFLQFSKQFTTGSVPNPGAQANTYSTALRRWQKPGDITDVRKSTTAIDFYVSASDALFINATYLRLKNLSLSYQLPQHLLQRYKIRHVKIFLEGQNLLTIMKNAAVYDPETGVSGIPPMKILAAGLQLSL